MNQPSASGVDEAALPAHAAQPGVEHPSAVAECASNAAALPATGEASAPALAPTPQSTTEPAPPQPHRLVLRNLAHDVGTALWLFLPVAGAAQRRPFRCDPRVVALALVFVLALSLLGDYAAAASRGGREPLFNIWGLHVLATRLVATAVALFLVAVAAKRLVLLLPLLSGWLAVEVIAAALAPLLAAAHPLAGQLFATVCAVVVGRIVWRELDIRAARRAIAGVVAGGAVWGMVAALPAIALFRSPPDGVRSPPLDIESTYVRQAELVENALAGVRESAPDVEETYFVGFASYARQNVFENEVRHVEALFRERFDADGRMALLINSRETLKELPLANGHNLAAVLRGVAAKMGEEDVLFLHMTSHGSRDHEFSVDFANLRLHDLSAEEIGTIVAEAGLPWRVIVVAACFSGGYIEPLKSPRALVMTASRADRMSFGCEHGREYTYFGEALYRDSVVDGDFVAAFEKARGIVAAREQREEHKPSEPQIWIGEEMARKLAERAGSPLAGALEGPGGALKPQAGALEAP